MKSLLTVPLVFCTILGCVWANEAEVLATEEATGEHSFEIKGVKKGNRVTLDVEYKGPWPCYIEYPPQPSHFVGIKSAPDAIHVHRTLSARLIQPNVFVNKFLQASRPGLLLIPKDSKPCKFKMAFDGADLSEMILLEFELPLRVSILNKEGIEHYEVVFKVFGSEDLSAVLRRSTLISRVAYPKEADPQNAWIDQLDVRFGATLSKDILFFENHTPGFVFLFMTKNNVTGIYEFPWVGSESAASRARSQLSEGVCIGTLLPPDQSTWRLLSSDVVSSSSALQVAIPYVWGDGLSMKGRPTVHVLERAVPLKTH